MITPYTKGTTTTPTDKKPLKAQPTISVSFNNKLFFLYSVCDFGRYIYSAYVLNGSGYFLRSMAAFVGGNIYMYFKGTRKLTCGIVPVRS